MTKKKKPEKKAIRCTAEDEEKLRAWFIAEKRRLADRARIPPSWTEVQAAAIRALENEGGFLTADALVAAASDVAHPMHSRFEWDDAIAARQYRRVVARRHISEVEKKEER